MPGQVESGLPGTAGSGGSGQVESDRLCQDGVRVRGLGRSDNSRDGYSTARPSCRLIRRPIPDPRQTAVPCRLPPPPAQHRSARRGAFPVCDGGRRLCQVTPSTPPPPHNSGPGHGRGAAYRYPVRLAGSLVRTCCVYRGLSQVDIFVLVIER